MKKVLKILFGIAFSICIVIGGYKLMKQIEYNQMVEIVKSNEVRELIKERLISYDEKALTNEGIIREYTIDNDSVNRNSMGGINFTIYLNKNKDMYVNYRVEKTMNNNFRLAGGGKSVILDNLLEELMDE
ncbi:DUF1310 domain-containing protein [Streptococcus suis]|nr:DUF1310 domain-containing protein [Streptococcus suis]